MAVRCAHHLASSNELILKEEGSNCPDVGLATLKITGNVADKVDGKARQVESEAAS